MTDTYLIDEAVKDAELEGGKDFAESIKHLLENDFIKVKRHESGTFYYSLTDRGKDYLENINENTIIY
jgi:predicted transcriptional regulator